MICIQDQFEDILQKAISGQGLTPETLAKSTGIQKECIEAALQGKVDELSLRALAPRLGLSVDKLINMAHNRWQPNIELPEGVALFNTPFPAPGYEAMTVNSYLVWSGQLAAAFDTGAHAKTLLAEIENRDLKLISLFITHTHHDHIAALPEILAAHPKCILYCPKKESLPGATPLNAGDCLYLESLKIQALQTSGHSPGALSYIVTDCKLRIAFVGDAIFCLSMGKAPSAYQEALENNRSQLLSLPETTILCPGHGPITSVADEKKHNPFF
ncbi:MAG: MBL fold metallo-hydrolase [Verrucomicrobiota bacterium]|nr:MBL fold metallo-hydrolase [Verrucomicrobiota bacterium]